MRIIFVFLHSMQMKLVKCTIINIIGELLNTFCERYHEELETKMRGSSFTFERIDLLEYHLHIISIKRGDTYIESPKLIKNKE